MKLHIGCFDQPLSNWHNADITPHLFISRVPFLAAFIYKLGGMSALRYQQHRQGVFRNVHYLDVRKPMPFAANSVNAVFSSHIIEHLHEQDAVTMLKECLRILEPGGVCRVVAPSLEQAVASYSESNPTPMLNAIFENNHKRAKNRHQWMYTAKSLCELMETIGYTEVRQCKYREGNLPDLVRIDNRPENSIYVEGVKP